MQDPTTYLAHWQQVTVRSSTTPAPLPARWSAAVGSPTVLPAGSATSRINAATIGDLALAWVFQETVGIATSTELELTFTVHYLTGATAHSVALVAYVETRATAPVGTLSFTVYWDTGVALGAVFLSELEVSQTCAGVGVCP